MNNSPSASSVNAGHPVNAQASWPRQITLNLSLAIEAPDQERLSYLQSDSGDVAIGFIADLFDMLNFESQLGVMTVNGISYADIKRHFQQFVP